MAIEERSKINGRTLLVAALFLTSIFIIALKLVTPTEIHIYLEGEEAVLSQIFRNYTLYDVLLIIFSTFIAGLSTMYLILYDKGKTIAGETIFNQKREKYEKILPSLKPDEQKVLQVVLDSKGIIPQSEIGEITGISKSSVSRALDQLESRDYVERRRRGMGNIIFLK